ncbi:MAG: hypothetical protein HC802_05130 [Caldilineaceae bacterium]|nr:hypothetical protein [Caldilineaceae bacterium]
MKKYERLGKKYEDRALWTPEPSLNRALQTGRSLTIGQLQRLRTGLAPSSRKVADGPALVESLDLFDPVQSRNLLAHLRRVAEKSEGSLPSCLPLHPKESAKAPGLFVAENNVAYLTALLRHLQRHSTSAYWSNITPRRRPAQRR